jgi:hypothetical protein
MIRKCFVDESEKCKTKSFNRKKSYKLRWNEKESLNANVIVKSCQMMAF